MPKNLSSYEENFTEQLERIEDEHCVPGDVQREYIAIAPRPIRVELVKRALCVSPDCNIAESVNSQDAFSITSGLT